MPSIVFHFPGGRYHATPWGNHVNEGLVEWPPSPWRILRALMATGFSKLGWREAPEEARTLVGELAAVLPSFRLPPATAAHTRHFMPLDSPNSEKRTKIFDAFARVGRDAALTVTWPADLPSAAEALLRQLVPKLSYLGRAESVVDARVVDDNRAPDGLLASADDVNRPGLEPVTLLAPMTTNDYERWRAGVLAERGEPRRGKARGVDPVPPDLVAALLVDTSFLQRHGWTQPPGSRRVHYYRPVDALTTSPRRVVSVHRVAEPVDTALLALASDTRSSEVLPVLARALPQAELLHQGLLSQVRDEQTPELSGRGEDGAPLKGHRHARLLPLCLNDPTRIDHFLVHAPMGLGASAQRALRELRRTYMKGAPKPLFVTLAGLGRLDDFTELMGAAVPELGEASVWRSRTPFVPPRHIKQRRHSLEDQVQAELASHGLPPAIQIEVLARDAVVGLGFHRFVRARRDKERRPPAPRFFGLRIVFERPVRGPVSIGYGSHFGLGLMVPAD